MLITVTSGTSNIHPQSKLFYVKLDWMSTEIRDYTQAGPSMYLSHLSHNVPHYRQILLSQGQATTVMAIRHVA